MSSICLCSTILLELSHRGWVCKVLSTRDHALFLISLHFLRLFIFWSSLTIIIFFIILLCVLMRITWLTFLGIFCLIVLGSRLWWLWYWIAISIFHTAVSIFFFWPFILLEISSSKVLLVTCFWFRYRWSSFFKSTISFTWIFLISSILPWALRLAWFVFFNGELFVLVLVELLLGLILNWVFLIFKLFFHWILGGVCHEQHLFCFAFLSLPISKCFLPFILFLSSTLGFMFSAYPHLLCFFKVLLTNFNCSLLLILLKFYFLIVHIIGSSLLCLN